MSFRGRLAAFFVLIVVVPTAAIALLVVDVTSDASAGKADAQLATGLETALSMYEGDVDAAKRAGTRLVADPAVEAALNAEDVSALEPAAAAAAGRRGIEYLRFQLVNGNTLSPVPARDPLAVAVLRDRAGSFELRVSVTDPAEYAAEISSSTGLDAAVVGDGGLTASTLPLRGAELPGSGGSADVEIAGQTVRGAAAELPGSGGERIVLFTELEESGFLASSPGIAAALAGFLLIALGFVFLVVRTLQGQVAAMLDAARRVGAGDFSRKVPVVGRDEMAGLASEFNKMSGQLAAHIEELRHQRDELRRSAERLGDAFAAGLDRDALLRIVLETALGACGAEYGRVTLVDGSTLEEPDDVTGPARDAALAGERRSARDDARVEARREDGQALSAPLRRLIPGSRPAGTMSIARRGEPFTADEQGVFAYLVGQATASLENISAHERVSEQAVTDELTGLANNRAFRESIEREAARAERFRHDLSLVMLDLDDFKQVNDTHGHLQGDEVLQAIGRILDAESRGIDEAARYGGEEFVVALPETGIEGALEVAERIRARIEAEPVPMLDGKGELRITASIGAASFPVSAHTVRELIAAADEALYRAKRDGKNRVVAAAVKSAPAPRQ